MIRALAVLCGVLAAVAVIAAPASAKMKVTGKFDVSGVGTNNEITKGPDGNVWVTLDQTNDIARITPKGKVKEFDPVERRQPGRHRQRPRQDALGDPSRRSRNLRP